MGTEEKDSESAAQQATKEHGSPETERESPAETPPGQIPDTSDPLNTYSWHTGSKGTLDEGEGGAASSTSTMDKIQKASTNKWNKMQNWRKALSEDTGDKNLSAGKSGEGVKPDKSVSGTKKNPFRRALSEPPGSLFAALSASSSAGSSANAASSSAAAEASGVSNADASHRASGGKLLKKYLRNVSQKLKMPRLQSRNSSSALLPGLSKAACIGHFKAIMSMAFFEMCGASSNDIIYITLPLYHMSASLLGIGGCIQLGATCVLKKKFSASQFWKDCERHNVTVVQYIGELCRYLVNHPMVPEERTNRVRLAVGSGLRLDVWKKFAKRFYRIKIREGYGLTEASIGFLNYTDEIGPIGRASYFNKLSMPFEVLKYDPQSNEPVRTDSGRCMRTKIGEAGILVAPLSAINQFLGYAGNKVQSEKKLLRDVFKAGDVYFNTGDLLLRDHRDFLYFHDRIGDTFRWKGENVSTTEVSEVLGRLDFIKEASVYGVTVPGHEGRAGMAAIVLQHDHNLNGTQLFIHLVQALPAYAWPRFLRVQTSLDVTETFKQKKMKLVQEGFNVDIVQDPLYYLDISQKDYIFLTVSVYQDIVSGKITL